jgi:hypothetical protein
MMVTPLREMRTERASKVAMQPEAQSWPIEMSEPEATFRKMCAVQAARGRWGMSNSAVWLELMMLPLERVTRILVVAGQMLTRGASSMGGMVSAAGVGDVGGESGVRQEGAWAQSRAI